MGNRLIIDAVIFVMFAVAIGAYGEHRYHAGVLAERSVWEAKITETNKLNAKVEAEATAAKETAEAGRASIAADILSRPLARLSTETAKQCSYAADDLAALNRITR